MYVYIYSRAADTDVAAASNVAGNWKYTCADVSAQSVTQDKYRKSCVCIGRTRADINSRANAIDQKLKRADYPRLAFL